MSIRTLILIIVLSVVAGVAVFIAVALKNETQQDAPQSSLPQLTPTPDMAYTTLSLIPNPLTISTPSASVDVSISTKTNKVTAVQLEISYDPKMLANVNIAPGTFFENPIVLLKKVDEKKGRIYFALGISPTQTAKQGTGNVATITFISNLTKGEQTQINVLPETLVTAEGIASSVLKSSQGTTVMFSQKENNAPPLPDTMTP